MEIILNNTKEIIDGHTSMTVSELLAYKNYTFKMLVIKINQNVVRRPEYSTAVVNDGDNVLVLHLISGG